MPLVALSAAVTPLLRWIRVKPSKVAGLIQAQRATNLDAPDISDATAAGFVKKALQNIKPEVPNIHEHDGTLAEFFGIEDFEIWKVRSQRTTTPSTYRFVHNDLSTDVGGTKTLRRQTLFLDWILEVYGRVLPGYPKSDWPEISQRLADEAILITPTDPRYPADIDENGRTEDWLRDYIGEHTIHVWDRKDSGLLGVHTRVIRDSWQFPKGSRIPFGWEDEPGTVYIFIDHFRVWLREERGEAQTERTLSDLLRQIGWTSRRRKFGKKQLSVWFKP